MDDEIAMLGADPAWLPHRVNLASGALELVRLDRDAHRALTFLTDEYIAKDAPRRVVPLQTAKALARIAPPGRCHFLFHSAFCCSTLLARAYDAPGAAMGLKEPVALMNLADSALAGTDPGGLLPDLLTLLARPFADGEAVIIKPTNIVNPMAEAMLAARPEAKALLLHAPLPVFLRSVAQKGLFGRIWARRSAALILRKPEFDPGYSPAERWEHTDLQVAALAWLQQQAHFARLPRTMPHRVATLDSETLLADPQHALLALNRFFGLDLSADWAGTVAAGPIFRTDAKSHAQPFDAAARAERHSRAELAYGEEIKMVVRWAEAVADHVGVPLRLDRPLLG